MCEEDNGRFNWMVVTAGNNRFQFSHFDELQRQLWIADMKMVAANCHREELEIFDRNNSMTAPKSKEREGSSSTRIILETDNQRLLTQINLERKALLDEEVVRQLATRMLDDEITRNENYRKTIEYLSAELETERDHRMFLEKRLHEAADIVESCVSPLPMDSEIDGARMDYLIISTQSV